MRHSARALALTAHYATQYGHGKQRVTRVQPALLLLRDEGVVSYEQDADEQADAPCAAALHFLGSQAAGEEAGGG